MSELMLASNTLLWVLVLALTVMVLALARQIGVLNDRVAPAGALTPTGGPKIGETTNAVHVRDLRGTDVTIGGEGKDLTTLLMFVSPTCPVCKTLVPTAMSLAKYEGFHLLFASDGDSIDAHRSYIKDMGIDEDRYVLSEALGMEYRVSKLPFAVLIDSDGTLASLGLVNTREHLESLVEAMRTGVATIQEYVGSYVPEPVKEA
ncbi:MAG TPA: methylamine dehydrogenase accessory protein MauD [Gammaproteobacteria bacterium]|nr:methylamine dehydrogenase accessory protein MauD [Gammaproteobacteria bacterium]HBP13810.1 methylamine dehydrogenase accessory protein MauD [Gammaproteobacteria bacterium]HCP48833.1 methylamine dehydrogenase accessory protein MauD [Gammaproteobacteria bacterium]|tara:strand:+ start:312 stop:923 length:612 start_codon:yes stop_codon:yes gene_type:complete